MVRTPERKRGVGKGEGKRGKEWGSEERRKEGKRHVFTSATRFHVRNKMAVNPSYLGNRAV